MTEVIAAAVTGLLALLGVVITNSASNKKIQGNLHTSLAILETKLEELTREVRRHNDFANRIPVIEEKVENLRTRIHS